jgi:hypothetical protein
LVALPPDELVIGLAHAELLLLLLLLLQLACTQGWRFSLAQQESLVLFVLSICALIENLGQQ